MKKERKKEEMEKNKALLNTLDEKENFSFIQFLRRKQRMEEYQDIYYIDFEENLYDDCSVKVQKSPEYLDAYVDTGYLDGSDDYADSNYYDLEEPPTYYDDAVGLTRQKKSKKTNRVEDVLIDLNKKYLRKEYLDAYLDTGYLDGSDDYADSNYYDLEEPPTKILKK